MLLEGPDIRTLLAQVREEHGPDARIVHAERVRSGGVGGFFAKQRFEVTVEIDGAAAGSASTPDQLAEQFASSAGGEEAEAPAVLEQQPRQGQAERPSRHPHDSLPRHPSRA